MQLTIEEGVEDKLPVPLDQIIDVAEDATDYCQSFELQFAASWP